MRNIIIILLLVALTVPSWGQVSSFDHFGRVDIGALLKDAQASGDMTRQDAVVLFDGCDKDILDDGRLRMTIHQIIWLGTDRTVDEYADYRIRYDSDRQRLEALLVRTWRDERSIDSDSTALVETLPFVASKTPDYANLRDLMLMHDGIELPCIIETAYRIEDMTAYRRGIEGAWVFGHEYPTVRSEFRFSAPKGRDARIRSYNGAPVLESSGDLTITTRGNWKASMMNLKPLPEPRTSDLLKEAPHVLYSTFKDWKLLGLAQRRAWDERLTVSDALRDSVQALIKDVPAMTEQARLVGKFAADAVRFAWITDEWTWDDARQPDKIYESGYACRYERALLAASLFKAAGFEAFPFYRSRGYGSIELEAPTYSQFEPIAVWVSGADRVEAWYEPESGELRNGLAPVFGRTIWIPGSGDEPSVSWQGEGTLSRMDVCLELKAAQDGAGYEGSGYLYADNGLCPFERMEGVGSRITDCLTEITSGFLPDAEVESCNPITFNRFQVELSFRFTMPLPKADRFERTVIELGAPGRSFEDLLPEGSDLTRQTRTSAVRLPGRLVESLKIVFPFDSMKVVYFPASVETQSEAGVFSLTVEPREGKMCLKRELRLDQSTIPAGQWGELRKLLLSARAEAGRKIILTAD